MTTTRTQMLKIVRVTTTPKGTPTTMVMRPRRQVEKMTTMRTRRQGEEMTRMRRMRRMRGTRKNMRMERMRMKGERMTMQMTIMGWEGLGATTATTMTMGAMMVDLTEGENRSARKREATQQRMTT